MRRIRFRRRSSCAVCVVLICFASAHAAAPESARTRTKSGAAATAVPAQQQYRKLADEVEAALRHDVLDVWFPRTVDNKNGGFRSDFDRKWKPSTRSGGKFSVFQGRMTWIAAQVAMRRPELKEQFLPITRHGLQYLNDTLWDKQYGGFYWGLDDQGQ